jgi:hypothetical protein
MPRLFTPVTLGRVTLTNLIAVSPIRRYGAVYSRATAFAHPRRAA